MSIVSKLIKRGLANNPFNPLAPFQATKKEKQKKRLVSNSMRAGSTESVGMGSGLGEKGRGAREY